MKKISIPAVGGHGGSCEAVDATEACRGALHSLKAGKANYMVDCMPAVERVQKEEANDSGRTALLIAAREAFAERGLEGARVDDIARRARINKQLVYHYFGSKDGLYTAVLEEVYREIRDQERALELGSFPAEEAMRKLIEFSFDYLAKSPEFVRILADENAHQGQHLKGSGVVSEVNRPIIELIRSTLARGEKAGVFRKGLDPLHVYLSIAGMSFFYFANQYTLTRAFDAQLGTARGVAERRAHIVDFALNAMRV